jgi:hypothetical protein
MTASFLKRATESPSRSIYVHRLSELEIVQQENANVFIALSAVHLMLNNNLRPLKVLGLKAQ